jgi:hypothetical protein
MHPKHRFALQRRRRAGIGLVLQRYIGQLTRERLEAAGDAAWPAAVDPFWQAYRTRAAVDASREVLAEITAELEGRAKPPEREPAAVIPLSVARSACKRPPNEPEP